MKRSAIVVLIFAVALVGTLYSLPKVVVDSKLSDDDVEKSVDSISAGTKNNTLADANHATNPLTDEQVKEIEKAKTALRSQKTDEKATAALSLSDLFLKFKRYDSSATYAEQAAKLEPTIEHFLVTGDRYYTAYGFAIDEAKVAETGKKTREYYQKALDLNPALLGAKVNMAMTYVNTETPMQGISMLREVLEADPTNEMALFNMGILSMRSNQFGKAADRFRAILVNDPNNSRAQFYLAASLVEQGNNEGAEKILHQLKKNDKDSVMQQAVEELEKRIHDK